MQKLLAAAVLVSPFVPLLFMGEEWAAPEPFLYFTDHSGKELVEAVRAAIPFELAQELLRDGLALDLSPKLIGAL